MWLPLLPLPEPDLARSIPVQRFSDTLEDKREAGEPEISSNPQDLGIDTAWESIQIHVDDTTQKPQLVNWAPVGIQKNDEIAELRKRNEEIQSRAEVVEELRKGIKELLERNGEVEALRKRNKELKVLVIELQTKLTQQEIIYEKAKGEICMHENRTESLRRRIRGLDSGFLHRFRFEQISETEIRDRFDTLCMDLDHWVATQFPWEDLTKKIFLDSGDPYLATFLNDEDLAGESIIGSLTHQCLQQEVFGEHVYLVGLSEDHLHCLQSIQTCMARPRRYPEQTREPNTISQWRSETLKALEFHPAITTTRNSHALSAAKRIFSFVQQFYPSVTNRQRSFTDLYEQVVVPSIALAVDMQTSWSQYTFIPAMNNPRNLYNFEKAKLDLITSVTAVDVKTRIPLSKNKPVVCDSDGFIGLPIMLVEPALCVYRHDNYDEDLLLSLRRGTYLIELFQQLKRPVKDNVEQASSAVAQRSDGKYDSIAFIDKLMQSLKQNHPQACNSSAMVF